MAFIREKINGKCLWRNYNDISPILDKLTFRGSGALKNSTSTGLWPMKLKSWSSGIKNDPQLVETKKSIVPHVKFQFNLINCAQKRGTRLTITPDENHCAHQTTRHTFQLKIYSYNSILYDLFLLSSQQPLSDPDN